VNKLGALDYVSKLAPQIKKVRRKTWIMIGLGLFATFAVALWTVVVFVGWLWGQTQTLAGSAPTLIRDAASGVFAGATDLAPDAKQALQELAAPAMAEAKQALAVVTEAGQKLDTVAEAKLALGTLAAPAVAEAQQALAAVTQASQNLDPALQAKNALAAMIPAVIASQIPATREVSGSDLGPVARFPGLQRTRWEQSGAKAIVEFEGSAEFSKVLEHYRNGMAKLGYAQAVTLASATAESHDYSLGAERIQFALTQLPAGRVNVRIETLRAEVARAELG